MADPIRTLLIENQSLTRLGVRTVISGEDDIELAGEADNGAPVSNSHNFAPVFKFKT